MKANLFFTEVLFVGAMVRPSSNKLNFDKVATVVNWPVFEDVQDLIAFLDLMNFGRLIANYTWIAAPLTDLIQGIQEELPKDMN
jgi:hypothetical protein